jgi:hypothetical protein
MKDYTKKVRKILIPTLKIIVTLKNGNKKRGFKTPFFYDNNE